MVPASASAKAASNTDTGSGLPDANVGTSGGGERKVQLVPSSRKEASTRRRELLAYLREPLREACTKHAAELMCSNFAGSILLEACKV